MSMCIEKKAKVFNFLTRCKREQNSQRNPPCSILAEPKSHKTVTQGVKESRESRSPGVQQSKSILDAHRIKAKTCLISMSSLSPLGHPTKQRSSWKWMQPFTIPSWSRQRPLPNWSNLVACPCSPCSPCSPCTAWSLTAWQPHFAQIHIASALLDFWQVWLSIAATSRSDTTAYAQLYRSRICPAKGNTTSFESFKGKRRDRSMPMKCRLPTRFSCCPFLLSCCMSTKTLDKRPMYFPTPQYQMLFSVPLGVCHGHAIWGQAAFSFFLCLLFTPASCLYLFCWALKLVFALECSIEKTTKTTLTMKRRKEYRNSIFLVIKQHKNNIDQDAEVNFAKSIEGPHFKDTNTVGIVIRQGKGAKGQHQAVRYTWKFPNKIDRHSDSIDRLDNNICWKSHFKTTPARAHNGLAFVTLSTLKSIHIHWIVTSFVTSFLTLSDLESNGWSKRCRSWCLAHPNEMEQRHPWCKKYQTVDVA